MNTMNTIKRLSELKKWYFERLEKISHFQALREIRLENERLAKMPVYSPKKRIFSPFAIPMDFDLAESNIVKRMNEYWSFHKSSKTQKKKDFYSMKLSLLNKALDKVNEKRAFNLVLSRIARKKGYILEQGNQFIVLRSKTSTLVLLKSQYRESFFNGLPLTEKVNGRLTVNSDILALKMIERQSLENDLTIEQYIYSLEEEENTSLEKEEILKDALELFNDSISYGLKVNGAVKELLALHIDRAIKNNDKKERAKLEKKIRVLDTYISCIGTEKFEVTLYSDKTKKVVPI